MFLFKRGKTYHFEYFDNLEKKKKRITTGCKTKSEAVMFMSIFLNDLEERKKLKIIHLKDFGEEYSSYSIQKLSFYYSQRIGPTFKKLVEEIGNLKLLDIDEWIIEKYLMEIHSTRPGSALGTLYILKGGFRKAIEWHYLDSNPCSKIKLPKRISRLPVTISRPELEKIRDSTKSLIIKDLFLIAYNTGK